MKNIVPQKKKFLEYITAGKVLPIYAEIEYDSFSPIDVYTALHLGSHAVLLESARVNDKTGRYSFVAGNPYLVFRSTNDTVTLAFPSCSAKRFGRKMSVKKHPLLKLRELMSNYRTERVEGLPPFTGGAVGFLSYDFVHQFEDIPRTGRDDLRLPDTYFVFVDTVVAFDHILHKAWVIVNPGACKQEMGFRRPETDEWGMLYDDAVQTLMGVTTTLLRSGNHHHEALSPDARTSVRCSRLRPNMTRARFHAMVNRCKEYIAAGDIYQANLSQRLSSECGSFDPIVLYEKLRSINPSPFAALIDFGDLQLISSSPERLICVRSGTAETRPIAGTRRRGKDEGERQKLARELLTNEKERAEHIMLLDLERNDLGRVCRYGSVRIDELMVVEDYSHVIHIVSNVRGELKKEHDCFDLIRAVFPGGTITGVPKVRCMEIIDELEPVARGPYTGSIGYISNAGDMDLNIIIRTFVVTDGKLHIQVGAGIVADSDPEHEYQETLRKAEALIKALEQT